MFEVRSKVNASLKYFQIFYNIKYANLSALQRELVSPVTFIHLLIKASLSTK